MVAIRLRREGTKNRPFYRIVAIDHRKSRQGAYLENLGTYNPMAKNDADRETLNLASVDAWISKGAQPSETVNSIIKRARKAAGAAAAK